jgi:nickel transport protein
VIAPVQGTAIVGEAYYVDGSPARGAAVTVLDPAGQTLGQTTTDSAGRFSFPLRVRCDHRVTVDAGDGHAKTVTVSAGEIPRTLPAWEGKVPASDKDAPTTAPSEPAGELAAQPLPQEGDGGSPPGKPADTLAAQLKALQEQLAKLRIAQDRHENKVRLHDVLGGIGCILGLMGLAFYFLGVRRRERLPKS